MKKLLLLLLLTTLFRSIVVAQDLKGDASDYIHILDSLLTRQKDFQRQKLLKIGEIMEKKKHASSDFDRFLSNGLLAEEYATFRADSALKYIDLNLDIANRNGNSEWKARTLLSKSNLLTGTGLLSEASQIMSRINRESLPDDLLTEYFGEMIYLYSHLGNYAGGDGNRYYIKERAYKDSIMATLTPDHPDYLWYKGWDVLGTDKTDDSLIPSLEKRLAESGLNTRRDAKEAYMLSKLYEWKGDKENSKKYMALSSIVDVKTANAEIASMEDLAKILFAENDIDHAYSYINYSLDQARSFPNRVRILSITKTIGSINLAYQERNKKQEQRIRLFLVVVCLLAVILFATVTIIIVQNRRLKKQRTNLDEANKSLSKNLSELSEAQRQLAEANAKLKDLNNDLQTKNDELNEANYVKEEYIGYVFTICSNYIRKLEDFRKSIHVKAVTRKFKEIEQATSSHDFTKEELKDFYHSFDTIFLHIYPDFVKDFNSLLQEDKRIIPKDGELLNTELRIYALVRLGITDSVKIADFLHCSPQTVYNNRFKVRNKAIIPKEKFAETVRTLGKFMERPS
ncbi:MAG: transcriptional regulator [Muribaculaceae bacterium]|nr:transcriptional regulator [Muribaculaceae bacterium]